MGPHKYKLQAENSMQTELVDNAPPSLATWNALAELLGYTPLTLSLPDARAHMGFQSPSEGGLHLEFDAHLARFSRQGDNLLIETDDGGRVTMGAYFAGNKIGELPHFVLADGTIMSGEDFLQEQSPGIDLATVNTPHESRKGVFHNSPEASSLMRGMGAAFLQMSCLV